MDNELRSNGIAFNQSLLADSPSIKLVRIIGSPLSQEVTPDDSEESLDLYDLAVKNKIPMLYLGALQQNGRLNELKGIYQDGKAEQVIFLNEMTKVSGVLEDGGVNFSVYKTIKPYPALLNDIDLVIMDDSDMYRKAAETLLKAHYTVELPVVETESLTDDDSYKRAARLATTPIFLKGEHISPTSTSFVTPDHNLLIDLRKELAMNYVLWMDKDNFGEHIIKTRLSNGKEVKNLAPELDLACTVAHSLAEHLYLLGDYYTFLFHLSKMGEAEVNNFFNMVRRSRITFAATAFITVTAALYQVAHGTLPEKLRVMCDIFGSDTNELKNLAKNKFRIPHRYRIVTTVKALLEHIPEGKFRRSVLRQMLSMVNPTQAKMVISELVNRRKKEVY